MTRPAHGAWLLTTLAVCVGCAPGNERLLLDPDHPAWQEEAPAEYWASFDTSEGPFVIHVRREWAPVGADRFHNLVRHGFFDDSRIFRVRPGFIAQFGIPGDPEVTRAWVGRRMPDDPVRESNVAGAVAYAMTGPDTRETQVYINLVDNTRLDADGFAPFGRVVSGMDAVQRFYGGYGEDAGGGMRGGNQHRMLTEGNRHLDADFPELDRIHAARVHHTPPPESAS